MKNYLFILFFIISFPFISCDSNVSTNEIIDIEEMNGFYQVTEFKYKEHKYLLFKFTSKIGFVHNPDCNCYYTNKSDTIGT